MATYDYTKPGNYPRSGRDQLGGVCFLPRSIDKMRAHIAGTHGEYNAKTGLSQRTFELFGVTADQFEQAIKENPTDEGALEWLYRHGRRPSAAEIADYNRTIESRGPATDEARARFRANLERLGFGDRTDITTYFDSEDLEEGRKVPRRG